MQRTLEQLLLLARAEGAQDFDQAACSSAQTIARHALADLIGVPGNERIDGCTVS